MLGYQSNTFAIQTHYYGIMLQNDNIQSANVLILLCDKYRITDVLKDETEIISGISVSPTGQL